MLTWKSKNPTFGWKQVRREPYKWSQIIMIDIQNKGIMINGERWLSEFIHSRIIDYRWVDHLDVYAGILSDNK